MSPWGSLREGGTRAFGGNKRNFPGQRRQAYDFTTLSLCARGARGAKCATAAAWSTRGAKSFEPADGPPLPTLAGPIEGHRVQKGSEGFFHVHHRQDRRRFDGRPDNGRRDDLG